MTDESPSTPSVTPQQMLCWLLNRVGSWTTARWDQHLRDQFGDGAVGFGKDVEKGTFIEWLRTIGVQRNEMGHAEVIVEHEVSPVRVVGPEFELTSVVYCAGRSTAAAAAATINYGDWRAAKVTEELGEPDIPIKPNRLPPDQCPHTDTDRVGPFEVVCFRCGCIADWRDLLEKKPGAWKPL